MLRNLKIKQSIIAGVIAGALAVILAFSFALPAAGTSASMGYDIDGEAEAVLLELCRMAGADSLDEWVGSYLTPRAGEGVEWYIIALRGSHPEVELAAYAAALEAKMSRGEIRGAVARQRCALALAACGRGESAAAMAVMDETIGALGIMSYIFGLDLMNTGLTSRTHTADGVIDALLTLQLEGGGWAVMGDVADADVTAMAVQALAPHRYRRADAAAAVTAAVDHLLDSMRESGTYLSYGAENPESAAQAVMALTACGIDPERDPRMAGRRTLIDGIFAFRLAGEGFSHTAGGGYNATATMQSLLALIALSRSRRGLSGIYAFEDSAEDDTSVPPPPDTDDGTVTSVDITTAAQIGADTTLGDAQNAPAPAPAPAPQTDAKLKLWIIAVILAAAIIAAAVLFICGRRHKKNFIFIVVVAAVLSAAVLLLDIRTPEGYYADTTAGAGERISVSISVRCDEALGVAELDTLPADGVMLGAVELELTQGGTVLDALTEAARLYRLQLEYSGVGSMAYVSGIEYLYEFDGGELSGWTYRVNGQSPSVGCGGYTLADGDVIEWEYTLLPKY